MSTKIEKFPGQVGSEHGNLPDRTLVSETERLLGAYKEALGNSPEFAAALLVRYFCGPVDRQSINFSIERETAYYQVKCDPNPTSDRLTLQRKTPSEQGEGWTVQMVYLEKVVSEDLDTENAAAHLIYAEGHSEHKTFNKHLDLKDITSIEENPEEAIRKARELLAGLKPRRPKALKKAG